MVSVIVAVYNTEKYLRECLDSLCRQTYSDLQIVCVDDASTDNSPTILDDYARCDQRIEVVRLPENRGQAAARNVALHRVRGMYVCMLDSDDWFSDDAIERAVSVFEHNAEVDCVLFQLIINGNTYPLPDFTSEKLYLSGDEAFEASLTWRLHGLYMTRTSLHKAYPFDSAARWFSDDNTTRVHYLKSRRVMVCSGAYYYRQHDSSVSHSVNVHRFDLLLANESMRRQMISIGATSRQLSIYERERWLNLVGMYMFYFMYRRKFSREERRQALCLLRHTWENIDTDVPHLASLKRKFGYIPMRWSWTCFRIQEEMYFFLRKIVGRNKLNQ